jgi:hypothetical protein
MSVILEIVVKIIGSILAIVILVPLVVLLCLPYLLLASLADKGEYWSSFWWRTKRLASAVAPLAGIIGAGADLVRRLRHAQGQYNKDG